MRAHPFPLVFAGCCLLLLLAACGYTQPTGTTSVATYTPSTNNSGIPEALAWSPDGIRLATAYSSGYIEIWQATTGNRLLVYAGHKVSNRVGGLYTMAWSPDGNSIVSGGLDGTAQVWEAATGKPIFTFTAQSKGVTAVAWSPDGTRIASGGGRNDSTVQVWEAATGKLLLTYTGHRGTIETVAWSPDGTRIASTGDFPAPSRHDQTMQIFDATSGKELLTYQGSSTTMCCVSWSKDGKRLLLVDFATVIILDATTGKSSFSYMYEDCQGEAGIQGGSMTGLAWSPNDQYIAMGACQAAVWQLQ